MTILIYWITSTIHPYCEKYIFLPTSLSQEQLSQKFYINCLELKLAKYMLSTQDKRA